MWDYSVVYSPMQKKKTFLCLRSVFFLLIDLYEWLVKMTMTITLHPSLWWLKTTAGENFLYSGGGKLEPEKVRSTLAALI